MENFFDKIRSYKKGFKFTYPFYKLTEKQKVCAYKLLRIAEDEGLIKCVSIGMGFTENGFDETEREYERL